MIINPGGSIQSALGGGRRRRRFTGGGSMPPAPGGTLTPSAPPPATPPPGSIQIPGITQGFYHNLLQNNPIYQQMGANFDAAGTAADAQRRSYIQRLLADFGRVPTGFQDSYGDVDDLTRGLAQKATDAGVSTYSQLERARADNQKRINNDLAARGILSSGETGYQQGRNQQDFQTSLSEAERALLDSLTGATTGYGQTVSDLAMQRAQGAQDTMAQILATNPVAPNDQAKLLQQSVGRGGHGWYGLDGQIYNQGGQALNIQEQLAKYLARVQAQRAAGGHPGQNQSAAWRRLQLLRQYLPQTGAAA